MARRPPSLAFVVRQSNDMTWHIVARSGPSRLGLDHGDREGEPTEPLPRGDGESDDDYAARCKAETALERHTRAGLEAMTVEAERRQTYAESIAGPDDHVLFVPMAHTDLAEVGITPL